MELHFEKGQKEFNKASINILEKFKAKIELATGKKFFSRKNGERIGQEYT